MKKKTHLFSILLVIILLASCNLPKAGQDAQSISSTAAAETINAMLSATPLGGGGVPTLTFTPAGAVPATLTFAPLPIITNTPLATATTYCNAAQFITDVTIPDDTVMTPGQTFTKTWRLKNVGTCSWTPSYALAFGSGDSMNGPASQALTGNVNPGQTMDISVSLTAPGSAGTYKGNWKLRDGSGILFTQFYVQIKVKNPEPPTAVPPTAVPPTAIVFTVTGVNLVATTFNEGTYVNCPKVIAQITTNAAGTVTYHWIRSDGPEATQTLTFAAAGTHNVEEKWYLGSAATPPSGGFYLGIYIDSPNNADFGHVAISQCTSP